MSDFMGPYETWRNARIAVLEKVLGVDYFAGKALWEVGAGSGQTSLHFKGHGAEVLATEGREINTKLIDPQVESMVFDNDAPMDSCPFRTRMFDIIIHWGLLYHLNNWQDDITHMVTHLNPGGILALESEVLDGTDPDMEIKVNEPSANWDQSVHGLGTRATAARIEAYLDSLGLKWERYDDGSMNVAIHKYDWVANPEFKRENKTVEWHDFQHGLRRFWIARKK
jgi:cyclopropane fatty-acyl-phospholipid synthase-like methyltransferase